MPSASSRAAVAVSPSLLVSVRRSTSAAKRCAALASMGVGALSISTLCSRFAVAGSARRRALGVVALGQQAAQPVDVARLQLAGHDCGCRRQHGGQPFHLADQFGSPAEQLED